MKKNLRILAGLVFFAAGSSGWSQLLIQKTIMVDQTIPDRGQYVSTFTWSDYGGLATISDVNVGLSLSSTNGTTMRLGQMYATLTFGTASESHRVAVLLNREGVTSASAFGSSLSSLNVTFDDASSNNIFFATNSTGTYAADGRIGVNPYGTRVDYNTNQITAGLSALNGDWLASNTWSLLVADTQLGNAGRLNSWSLQVQGAAPTNGTFSPGANATVSGSGRIASTLEVASGALAMNVTAGQSLSLDGGLTGAGGLSFVGGGTLFLAGNSSGFSGTVTLDGAGTTEIASTTALGSGTLVQSNGNSTIRFSAAGTLSNALSVYRVAFRTNGTTLAGTTTVNNATFDVSGGNTNTISGKITGSGGVTKTGSGSLILSGSEANDFTGASHVYGGVLQLQKDTSSLVAISGGTIALHGGTLLLGQANQISDSTAVTLDGGTLNTAGLADRVGMLSVTGDSTISGLVTSAGGVATGSDFLFSGVDLGTYSGGGGSSLNLGGIGYGQSVNIASSDYTGWSGYSTANLNTFADKIQFGSTGMKAEIAFNGSSGLTYVTAIPEPKVYVALATLCVLVGFTEYRRRRQRAARAI